MFSPPPHLCKMLRHMDPGSKVKILNLWPMVQVYMDQHKDLDCNIPQLKLKSDKNQVETELQKKQTCSFYCFCCRILHRVDWGVLECGLRE